ncbi:centromere protein U isoform X1 [Pogona vitticeps]
MRKREKEKWRALKYCTSNLDKLSSVTITGQVSERSRGSDGSQRLIRKMSKRKRRDSKKRPGKQQAKLVHRSRFLPPEEPDVSSILKIPGNEQMEEPDDLFEHPLHSTAMSAYAQDGSEKDQYSEQDGGTSNSSDSETEQRNTIGSKNCHTLKSRVEREESEEEPVKDNMMPRRSAKSHERRKQASPETEQDCPDDPHLIKVWVPKGLKKVASRITESDVILDEFGKITAKYRQGVESKICRKAIDSFYAGFKDQLIKAITDAEELKNAKLKNTKMIRTTNKKRQRLIEVKEELIRTEPQLKKLERERAELKGKISSLRNAVQLVTDLKDLQQKYANERKENQQEKVVYGVSSLPALLVESQRILGAEGHFRSINAKLEQALDLQKKN